MLGQAPKPGFLLPSLKSLKIDYVCVLLSSEELRLAYPTLLHEYESLGIRVILFPLKDFGIPRSLEDFGRLVKSLSNLLRMQKTILMHCRGGIGRTGLVASCILIKMIKNMTAERAIDYLRQKIPFAVETSQQVRFVKAYEKEIRSEKNQRRH